MNGVRQGWLVARREIRERSRSRAFQASVLLMVVGVAAVLILPALLKPGSTRDIGLTGPAPAALAATITQQARAAGVAARVHPYPSLAAGEQAVRQGHLDVLVADARRLEWKGTPDEQLKAMVAGAIQLATVRQRADAAGISPGSLAVLLAPVPVTSVELGPVAGRSPGDETAVVVMTIVLFFGISVFGQMVLTGVLEEKSSRVVEVLLARIPARALLAGKIAGIGLRDVWRGRMARTATAGTDLAEHRMLITVLTGVGVTLGVAVAIFTHDVIIGVTAGAGFIATATQMVRLWGRHAGPPVAHR